MIASVPHTFYFAAFKQLFFRILCGQKYDCKTVCHCSNVYISKVQKIEG